MSTLTRDQIERLKAVLEDGSRALAHVTTGYELDAKEIDRLVSEGYIKTEEIENLVAEGYHHGAVYSRLSEAESMTADQFRKHLEANPLELSDVEQLAFQNALARAGSLCVGLGNRWSATLNTVIVNADAALATRQREIIGDATANAIALRKTRQQLATDLRQLTSDWGRDWDRIAATELHQAHQEGYAESVIADYGNDALLAKVPEPDACEHCIRLYTEGGVPITKPASWWYAQGTNNAGRKQADWKPVIGALHPWCRCQLQRVPAGWSITEDGELLPPGAEKGFRAARGEILRKAYKLQGRRKWHGLDLSIENRKGSTRSWYDPHAKRHGKTRMHHSYGYVRMSEGTDGDHVDVYIGPDSSAKKVYVIHQMRAPDFKEYDEDKCMLDFPSLQAARAAYLKQYDNPRFLGSVSTMTVEEFVEKVQATRGKPRRKRVLKSLVERGDELRKAMGELPPSQHPDRSVGGGTFAVHQDLRRKRKRDSRTVIEMQGFMDRLEEWLRDVKKKPPRLLVRIQDLNPTLFEALGPKTTLNKDPWATVQGEHMDQQVERKRERTRLESERTVRGQKTGRETLKAEPRT